MVVDTNKKEHYSRVAKRIKSVMAQLGLSQADLIDRAEKEGYILKQSALSKMLSDSASNMSITAVVQIANTLKIDLNDLLSLDDTEELSAPSNVTERCEEESMLITRADDKRMRPYMKTYHTYFFPTLSSDEGILSGKLRFYPSEDRSKCMAHFSFKTGKLDTLKQPIEKKYDGELVLSPMMSAAYCSLKNEGIGEISYILFSYMPILYETLKCRVALVLTSSAGSNRMPTVHRMIITEDAVSAEGLEILQGQLYLNESEILISEVGLDKFLADKKLDDSVREYFCKPDQGVKFAGLSPMPYYRFDESVIREAFLDSDVKTKAINLIRRYSVTPKYNKIGTKCDELVYRFICDEKKREQWQTAVHQQLINNMVEE